jgi:hypothetical protein
MLGWAQCGQKHSSNAAAYVRRFQETRNKCYSLTIGEKYLAELAFVWLTVAMRDKMHGQHFADINQLLQRAVMHENQAKEGKHHGRFRETASKEKPSMNYVEEDSTSDDVDSGVCMAKWVNAALGKPLM